LQGHEIGASRLKTPERKDSKGAVIDYHLAVLFSVQLVTDRCEVRAMTNALPVNNVTK
jgi:hypothetical protein